ncbi:uncharacterized protein LOC113336810 [Papaver somniferum]|uniref:uncharacterized protein LOC113336810 n=1 Tax=Papaver somniferum TaxID=3469 RepID=UPI000E6F4E7E|nr:uncharacterized protein LOC113336810 [Papaver somniferum]
MEQITREYGFDAYTGKIYALNMAWGEDEKSFAYLNWFTKQLSETNPRSRVVLETDGSQKFMRLFISFGACIREFNHCHPLLFMDAAHLKSKYLGHLMAATRLNGNNAYAVVSAETDTNWKWFMEHLREVVSPQRKLTFVSDREFSKSWDKLMLVKNQKLQDYLSRAPVDKWEEREMLIAVMVDKIRLKLMEMMCTHREESATSVNWRGVLCPKMETELFNNKMHGRAYCVTNSSEFVYEVHASLTQTVDLKEKTRSYNRWKINGFPCAHDVRYMMANGEDPYKYVQHYFTTKSYRESYSRPIHPVPTAERPATITPKYVVHGPKVLPQLGRPSKKKRIPNTGSISKKKMRTCGSCNELTTHNRRKFPTKQI